MSEPYIVKPDQQFIDRLLDEGGEDLKKCYQCATCSVVCELSNGGTPFPRKEMIWAQWGLKDRLVADPDVWLCHQCNDCSTRCPRGARPGDVLSAIRQQHVEHYAMPRFLATCANRAQYVPLMLLIPVVLLLGALLIRGPVENIVPFKPHHGFYAALFPHWLLIGFFSFFTGLAALAAVGGAFRFWMAMKAADASAGRGAAGRDTPTQGIVPSAINTVKAIIFHDRFSKCTDRPSGASRRPAHLLAFYGFITLFIVTIWAVIDLYVMPFLNIESLYPFNLAHPMKIFANVGCVVLIIGCIKAIRDRVVNKEELGASTAFDWIFVWLLLGVAVSGLATEILRFASEPAHGAEHVVLTPLQIVAYGIYFVHLVLVFDLLVYLPYSKFAHIIYRTVAVFYAEHSGRSKAVAGSG